MRNWIKQLLKHYPFTDGEKAQLIYDIENLLIKFAKDMIGEKAKPDWWGDEMGYNLKRKEMKIICKKWGVKV